MVGELLKAAMAAAQAYSASDIHLSTESGLHFRSQGSLIEPELEHHQQEALRQLLDAEKGWRALLKGVTSIIAPADELTDTIHRHLLVNLHNYGDQISRGDIPPDIDDVIRLGTNGSWRLNLYASDIRGLNLALRRLPGQIPELKELLPPPLYSHLMGPLGAAMNTKQGLFLVTGSTGSGKSSTLAALIHLINSTRALKIVTLEDPVEYQHASNRSIIHHRQIGVDVPSFELGLRSAMRQDPDIIMLGELRDLETISRALTAAETGHLILATLHSRNAASTITRLVDVFPAARQPMVRAQLASSLIGIMSQELVASESPAAERFGGRVLVPEVAILPAGEGGVRSPIHDGRFGELKQNLEIITTTDSSIYFSAKRSLDTLHNASYL